MVCDCGLSEFTHLKPEDPLLFTTGEHWTEQLEVQRMRYFLPRLLVSLQERVSSMYPYGYQYSFYKNALTALLKTQTDLELTRKGSS
jgi:hypothetical protein